jgi:hypothetical protein
MSPPQPRLRGVWADFGSAFPGGLTASSQQAEGCQECPFVALDDQPQGRATVFWWEWERLGTRKDRGGGDSSAVMLHTGDGRYAASASLAAPSATQAVPHARTSVPCARPSLCHIPSVLQAH